MKLEVGNATTEVPPRVQGRGGQERSASVAQAARDLDVQENVLRKWVKEFGEGRARHPKTATYKVTRW